MILKATLYAILSAAFFSAFGWLLSLEGEVNPFLFGPWLVGLGASGIAGSVCFFGAAVNSLIAVFGESKKPGA